jgi:hypothetical protein
MNRSMPTSIESVLAHLPMGIIPANSVWIAALVANWFEFRRWFDNSAGTASSSQLTAERPSGTAPPSAMVLFPACRARAFAFVWRHGGECRGGGADVCYEATATSLSGGAATDRVSGFGAGSTRDMAKNGFGEAAIDADVLPRDIPR